MTLGHLSFPYVQTVDKLRNPVLLDEIHFSHVREYAPRADFIRAWTFEVFNSLDFVDMSYV